MKKLLFLLIVAFALVGCGGPGIQPTDNITLGAAFNHVSQSFEYWLWIVIVVIAAGVYWYKRFKDFDGHTLDFGGGELVAVFITLVLLGLAILFRPCEVAANTTVEQAARGVFIGY